MPNPSGANGVYIPEPAYGDVQTQQNLSRQAPLSGAPVAAHATNAPRRAQRNANARRQAAMPQPGEPNVPMQQLPAPTYEQTFHMLAQRLAADPLAGDNVRWLASVAARQASPGGAPLAEQ